MFCAKCGKKIDERSTFCPYCGQKVNARVKAGKGLLSGGMKNKMMLLGSTAVLVVVGIIVFGVVKLSGSSKFGRTPLEKIFAMSWEESSAITVSDIKEMLDEEGIIYESESSNYDTENVLYFETDEEKRLWYMQNYSYDTSAGKAVDKEVVDALIAYQNYVSTLPDIEIEEQIGYTLIYLNDDEIPECLVWAHPYSVYNSDSVIYGMIYVLSYNNGTVQMLKSESPYQFSATFLYTPRMGKFCITTVLGLRSATDWVVAELDSDYNKIGDAWRDNDYEGNYYNYLNNSEVEAEEIDTYINSFGFEISLYNAEATESILSAYDVLGNSTYSTFEFCIYQFEVNDNILSVSADKGSNARFGTDTSFSFSYPVSEDCIWEDGYWGGDYNDTYVSYGQINIEAVMEDIKKWRKIYEADPENLEIPVGINFCIVDDEIVRVYTTTP